MKLNEYQKLAMRTKNKLLTKTQLMINGAMGLNGEAGELIDHIKKHMFQGHKLDKGHIIDELGDILWYIALTAEALDVTLEEIASYNINKLIHRYPEGFKEEKSINREV